MLVLRIALKAFLLAACVCGGSLPAQEMPSPGTRWVGIYGWLQIGEKLAEAEQWPLAVGSYIQAHQQLKSLVADSPEFEPEMTAYRMEWLMSEIEKEKERLDGGDHRIMMKYLDFIESYEQGQSLRFNDNFDSAYDTLEIAKTLLDEIIAERPAEFKTVMSQQYNRLLDSLDWLGSQLDYEARSQPAVVIVDTTDWGTTQFIREDDLPERDEAVFVSSNLFPSALLQSSPPDLREETVPSGNEAADTDGSDVIAAPAFRMSSKKSEGDE